MLTAGKLAIEIGIVLSTKLGNSPYGQRTFQIPYMLIERGVYDNYYIKAYQESRTYAKQLDEMNPRTALWKVGAGYTLNGFNIEIGHQSEHDLNIPDKYTESFNYIELKYREEY